MMPTPTEFDLWNVYAVLGLLALLMVLLGAIGLYRAVRP